VALGAPLVVAGLLVAIPLLDRAPDTDPRRRVVPLALLAALFVVAGALTIVSLVEDAGDAGFVEAEAEAARQGRRARALAADHGVPTAGGLAVFQTEPGARARALWGVHCAGCHEGDERQGPELGPGFGSRAHIRDLLRDPGGPRFFGPTGKSQMPPV